MRIEFDKEAHTMFYMLGQLSGLLSQPDHVEGLTVAISHHQGGADTRLHLLKLHAVLGEVLAATDGPLPTIQ